MRKRGVVLRNGVCFRLANGIENWEFFPEAERGIKSRIKRGEDSGCGKEL